MQLTIEFPEPKSLSRQCHKILAALQDGPKMGHELNQIAQRFGGRLLELRQAGHVIDVERVTKNTFRYTLK